MKREMRHFVASIGMTTVFLALTHTATAVDYDDIYGCDLWYAECSATYRINVGSMHLTHEPLGAAAFSPMAHVYGSCGDNYFAGTVPYPALYGMTFYIGSALFEDRTSNSVSWLNYQLKVLEFANSDCTGAQTLLGTDAGYWATPVGMADQYCWSDGTLSCGGGTDPGTCHMPDVVLSRPSGSGIQHRCYRAEAWLRRCLDSPSSNCPGWLIGQGDVKVDWQ